MEYTLDRIEDGVAVLIDGESKIYECSPDILPENSRDGEIFVSEHSPDSDLFAPVLLSQKRKERSERIKGLFEKLKNKNGHIER